jgi:arylsulfatase A-like enzyme
MSKGDRPNVLFFFTDDQRFDTIRALGNDAIKTPNIDNLVNRGTAFTRAHIPGGTCGAVCMPSRAMLHTGRSLFHIEGSGDQIPREHTTLGEAFRGAGYRTFGTGKWHNGRESYHRSFTDGDEIFFGGMADHWNVPAYHYDPSGKYDEVRLQVETPHQSNKTTERSCDHIHVGRHSSEILCDAAVNFIRDHDSDDPFFIYVSFLAPHDPRTMPQRFLDMYEPEDIELPPNFMGGHPFDNGELHIRDEELAGFPRTPKEIRRHIAEYYAMISHLDHEMGRVLEALEEGGELDNTIIVFSGDNGLALGQHGLMGKQSCYDHSVRVPLVFAGPGIPEGKQTDALVYLYDVYPTLCDMAEVEIPDSVEGLSLTNTIYNPESAVRDELYLAYTDLHRGIRTGDYKLIEYVVDGGHNMTQLFSLADDPWELNNLAGDPGYAEKVDEMREKLFALRDDWDDADSEWGERFWAGF